MTRHSEEIATALAIVRALEPDLIRVVVSAALDGDEEAHEYLQQRPDLWWRAVELGVVVVAEPGAA